MNTRIVNSWRRFRAARFFTPARTLVVSFAGLILLGTIFLMLPQASTGPALSLIDALFMSTSATCVTGLVVVDIGTRYTLFGQLVTLALIQLGGLGIMTFSTLFAYLIAGRLSLGSRDLIQETFSQEPMQHLKSLLKTVFVATMMIEGIGAVLLTARFAWSMPIIEAAYFGIFHAVSAFCNAGFALYPDSFISYQGDWLVNVVIMALITLGGLGFIVIFEIQHRRFRNFGSLSLHSRLVLVTSALLVLGGALIIFLLEFGNTLHPLPWHTRILSSLFQSVTTRTAGFNTLDLGSLSNATLFVMIVLMIIGASPGSCGGGIKTSTFAVIVAMITARFRDRESVNIHFRRIPYSTVSKAISITIFSFSLITIFTMLLLITELAEISHQASRGQFLELLFEVSSAFGTVGLSMGKTPFLSSAGRVLIVLLMFIGRLGPVTVALAVGTKEKSYFKQAEENVLVG